MCGNFPSDHYILFILTNLDTSDINVIQYQAVQPLEHFSCVFNSGFIKKISHFRQRYLQMWKGLIQYKSIFHAVKNNSMIINY